MRGKGFGIVSQGFGHALERGVIEEVGSRVGRVFPAGVCATDHGPVSGFPCGEFGGSCSLERCLWVQQPRKTGPWKPLSCRQARRTFSYDAPFCAE